MRNPFVKSVDLRNCTLLEFVYARTRNLRKTGRVVTLISTWDLQRRLQEVDSLTVDDYCEYWNEKRSTVYLHREEFREVFGHDDVDRVVTLVQAQQQAAESGR